jgi:hypothetical protein
MKGSWASVKRNAPVKPKGAFHLFLPPLWFGGTRVPPFLLPASGGDVNIKDIFNATVKYSRKIRDLLKI